MLDPLSKVKLLKATRKTTDSYRQVTVNYSKESLYFSSFKLRVSSECSDII